MAFEKKVLAIAESLGLEGAYFFNGSLCIPLGGVGLEQIKRFVNVEYVKNFRGTCEANLTDDEVLIDFKL